MKIFVASLYSSFILCPTSNRDSTLKNVQDDKAFLLTSDLYSPALVPPDAVLAIPSQFASLNAMSPCGDIVIWPCS